MTEQKITLELTDLEARALENLLVALSMPVGEAIRAKQYDWQKERLANLQDKLEAQRYGKN